MVMGRVTNTINGLAANDGSNIEDQAAADIGRRGGSLSGKDDDIRIGKMMSPKPKGDCYGAAVGMCSHFSSGVWCGFDDLEGFTGIPGLWVAGDGINDSAALARGRLEYRYGRGQRHCDGRGADDHHLVRPPEDSGGDSAFQADGSNDPPEPLLGLYLQPRRHTGRCRGALPCQRLFAEPDDRRGSHGVE